MESVSVSEKPCIQDQIEVALAIDNQAELIELAVEDSFKSDQIAVSESNSEVKKTQNGRR